MRNVIFAGCLLLGLLNLAGCPQSGPADLPDFQPLPFATQSELDRDSAEALDRLCEPISLTLQAEPIRAALARWAKAAGVNLRLDWTSPAPFEFPEPPEPARITLAIRDVPAWRALERMLEQADPTRTGLLDYDVRGGMVWVSTAEKLAEQPYTLCYNVRDLKATRLRAWVSDLPSDDPGNALGPYWWQAWCDVRLMLDMIRTLVLPDQWALMGQASLEVYEGVLLVRHWGRGHREAARLLAEYRWAVVSAGPLPPGVFRHDESSMERFARRGLEWERAAARTILGRLDGRLGRVDFEQADFRGALADLASRTGVTIDCPASADPEARLAPVTLHAGNISPRQAMARVCDQSAGQLVCCVQPDRVVVATARQAETYCPLRIYNVHDLMAAECTWVQSRLRRRPPPEPPGTQPNEGEEVVTNDGGLDRPNIVSLILDSVRPESWDPTRSCNIVEHARLLLVRQTCAGHNELAGLLARLRAALAADGPPPPDAPAVVLNPWEEPIDAAARKAPAGLRSAKQHFAAQHELDEALDKVHPRIEIHGPLRLALADLAATTGLPLGRVDWAAIGSAGIKSDTPIDVRLANILARNALEQMLRQAAERSSGSEALDYDATGAAVDISAAAEIGRRSVVRVYSVRDLFRAQDTFLRRHWRARHDLGVRTERDFLKGVHFWYEESPDDLFSFEVDWCKPGTFTGRLLGLLRTAVLPDSWRPSGEANIVEYQGLLAIRQSPPGHRGWPSSWAGCGRGCRRPSRSSPSDDETTGWRRRQHWISPCLVRSSPDDAHMGGPPAPSAQGGGITSWLSDGRRGSAPWLTFFVLAARRRISWRRASWRPPLAGPAWGRRAAWSGRSCERPWVCPTGRPKTAPGFRGRADPACGCRRWTGP